MCDDHALTRRTFLHGAGALAAGAALLPRARPPRRLPLRSSLRPAAGGPELDRRRIEVTNPIKTVGSHQVSVRLHPEVSASLEVEIVGS